MVVFHIRHQQTQGRVHAGSQWDQHGRNAQIAGHSAGMHRATATEGNQCEVPDIVAPLGGDGFDGFLHLDLDDLENTVCGF
jgi:hypothetical protein